MLYNEEFEEFRPNDYCELAHELYNKIGDFSCKKNALLRCIINRAYYASFLQIRQALINKGYKARFNGRGEHKTLHNILKKDKPFNMFINDTIKDKNYDLKKIEWYVIMISNVLIEIIAGLIKR